MASWTPTTCGVSVRCNGSADRGDRGLWSLGYAPLLIGAAVLHDPRPAQ